MLRITSLQVVLIPPFGAESWVVYVEWVPDPRLKLLGPMPREAADILARVISAVIDDTNKVVPVA